MISHRGNEDKSSSVITSAAAPRSFGLGAVVLTLAATYVGCGGGTTANSDKGGSVADDAGATAVDSGTAIEPTEAGAAPDSGSAAVDAAPEANSGGPSSVYPAFKVDVAQVVDNGGPVLSDPVIVTITWPGDSDAPTYQALGDSIGASTYWSDINSEYGVGKATSLTPNHVVVPIAATAAGFNDQDLDAYVEANVGATWPAPTANTVYALYLPPGSPLYLGGPPDAGGQDGCAQGIGGYHTESQNKNYVYAIMPHCAGFATADVELGASHELNEAATDPHPGTNPAWVGFDPNHLAFEFFNQFQDELGDACEGFSSASDAVDFTPYTVQRQWSNKSAAAGGQWCLPKLPEPMYNTTFLPSTNLDTISVNLSTLYPGAGTVQSKGFKMALNSTRTFPIGLFSDMATSAPFTLDVYALNQPIGQDQSGNAINNGAATITIDKTSGVNGDIANVTVTPTAYSSLGVVFFAVRAQLPGSQQHHYLPILISQN